MNLSQLVHEVWKDPRTKAIGLRKDKVKILVEVVVDHIFAGLMKHGRVKIKNLFTLDIREAKGRNIRNPNTKKLMKIADYYRISLIPSQRLRQGLKKFKK